jgi:hypothetical protein
MNINFQQARKLKAIGFDLKCDTYYYGNGHKFTENSDNYNRFNNCYSAPTLDLALEYMRTKIECSVNSEDDISMFDNVVRHYGHYIFKGIAYTTKKYKTRAEAGNILLNKLLNILIK